MEVWLAGGGWGDLGVVGVSGGGSEVGGERFTLSRLAQLTRERAYGGVAISGGERRCTMFWTRVHLCHL